MRKPAFGQKDPETNRFEIEFCTLLYLMITVI